MALNIFEELIFYARSLIELLEKEGIMKKGISISVCTIVLVALAFSSSFGQMRWVETYLDYQRIYAVAVNPQSPRTLFAGTHVGGVFKSTNGGDYWEAINNGITDLWIRALAIDPHRPDTLYAATEQEGIFMSTDGGTSWSTINPPSPYDRHLYAFAIDPQLTETLYAGGSEGMFKSYKTPDGVINWTSINNGLQAGAPYTYYQVYAIAIDPQKPEILYAGTRDGGLFKTTTAGTYWSAIGPNYTYIHALAINPLIPDTLYAGTWGGGLFKSTNGGSSWSAVGANNIYIRSIAIDPQTPETIYVGTAAGYGGQNGGVFKSTDGGASWTEMNTGLTNLDIYSLAIDPQEPEILYAGTDDGVYKLQRSWTAMNTGLPANSSIFDIVINPQGSETLYAGSDANGVFKITSGTNWYAINSGITNLDVTNLAIDPQTPDTLYAGTWGGGVFKSTNGGDNWTAVNNGITDLSINALAVDSQTPESLYIGTDQGVFKSTNGGMSWTVVNNGLPINSTRTFSLATDPQTTGILYAGTYKGVFKSTNAGVNWTSSGLTGYPDDPPIIAIAINPQNPEILYAARSAFGALYKSTDGGASWILLTGTSWLSSIAIDPQRPDTLYYASTDGAVHKSIDGGLSWYEITANLPLSAKVYTLAIDPQVSEILYAGTSDGVYKLGPIGTYVISEITVITPNGGEDWVAGTTQTISWSYTGTPGSTIKIDLLKGGALDSSISSSCSIGSGGMGFYSWLIPPNQTQGSDYQVRVTSKTNAVYADKSNGNFTISEPAPSSIKVTSPNGGESWAAGSMHTIQWTYTGDPGSYVVIELLKSGALNRTIIGSVSKGANGSGSYSWPIPSTQAAGSDYQVRVTSATNSSCTDTSDSNFTITGSTGASIKVTSPNGGENWAAGSTQAIQWTYTGNPGNYVKIELLKGGVLNRTISTTRSIGTGGTGSYSWSIPSSTAGSDYQIRVTSTSNSACTDTSDGNFTITGPSIKLTSPNGGENWAAGSTQTIQWTYTGNPGTYVKIELLKGGVLNRTVISSVSKGANGSGSYNWAISSSQAGSSDYQIRVTSTSNSACTDTSDGNFTITGPSIRVTSPNGGENWVAGSTQAIQWTYTGEPGTYVKVELLKGGVLNRTIASSASKGANGSGSYSWVISPSQISGSDYQVRVTSTSNGACTDTSDGNFRITGASIRVTSPNGGESWSAGSTQTIQWTYTGDPGSYVKIELLKSGVLSRIIASSASKGANGSGSYVYVISSTQASGSDYQVRVTSTSNSACSDTSDGSFTIMGPSMMVTSPKGGDSWPAGSTQVIRWTYTGDPGNYVKIELLKGGVLNRTISTTRPIGSGGAGSYSWSIPSNIAGSDYQIRVTSTSNSAYTDTSDGFFTIGP